MAVPVTNRRTFSRGPAARAAGPGGGGGAGASRADFESALVAQIPGLRRYAMALLGNSPEAEDLVQECLLRALERVRAWDSIKNLRAYLFSILHNAHVDRIARNRRAGIPVPLEAAVAQLTTRPGQIAHLEAGDLARALQRLPAGQRQVLVSVGIECASYREAARRLRVPMGTVMSRLARGRVSLRRMMGDG